MISIKQESCISIFFQRAYGLKFNTKVGKMLFLIEDLPRVLQEVLSCLVKLLE